MTGRRGRPPKRTGTPRPNAGRKPKRLRAEDPETGAIVDLDVSERTIERRAKRLVDDPQINRDVLLKAIEILDRRNSLLENEGENDESMDVSENESSLENHDESPFGTEPHTKESALAFFLENDYSVREYKNLVSDSKARIKGLPPIYPSYHQIDKAKKNCLEGLVYTKSNESIIECSLQSMLDNSSKSLLETVALDWEETDLNDLEFLVTTGFDSSSGHKNPHQEFTNTENVTLNPYQTLFATVCVLLAVKSKEKGLLWINPTPQSVRFCRPIRLSFESETADAIHLEKQRLMEEIQNLHPYSFTLSNGKSTTVTYSPELTLVDGKCLNHILENDCTTRCPICGVHMKKFNTSADRNAVFPDANLKHGVGLLHCIIKTFEFLLHLSYKLPLGLKTWDCPACLKRNYAFSSYNLSQFSKILVYGD